MAAKASTTLTTDKAAATKASNFILRFSTFYTVDVKKSSVVPRSRSATVGDKGVRQGNFLWSCPGKTMCVLI
jgi:hypothetical protein